MATTCRVCGSEVVWVQAGTARIPLDPRPAVYRITSTAGTPSAEKASSVLGMPFTAMVDHRRVCNGVKAPGPVAMRAMAASLNHGNAKEEEE